MHNGTKVRKRKGKYGCKRLKMWGEPRVQLHGKRGVEGASFQGRLLNEALSGEISSGHAPCRPIAYGSLLCERLWVAWRIAVFRRVDAYTRPTKCLHFAGKLPTLCLQSVGTYFGKCLYFVGWNYLFCK